MIHAELFCWYFNCTKLHQSKFDLKKSIMQEGLTGPPTPQREEGTVILSYTL